jgi:hypothetical protein
MTLPARVSTANKYFVLRQFVKCIIYTRMCNNKLTGQEMVVALTFVVRKSEM